MRPIRFFLTAACINLVLFIFVYLLPFSPLRALIGYLTSAFVFLFGLGLRVSVIMSKEACFLATTTGSLQLYQTFYELLTIIALTIPLYASSWKKMLKRVGALLAIMIGYYVFLYGTTILLLQNGFKMPWLISFINFNTESFMMLAFGLIWFFVNKNEIMNIVKNLKKH